MAAPSQNHPSNVWAPSIATPYDDCRMDTLRSSCLFTAFGARARSRTCSEELGLRGRVARRGAASGGDLACIAAHDDREEDANPADAFLHLIATDP